MQSSGTRTERLIEQIGLAERKPVIHPVIRFDQLGRFLRGDPSCPLDRL
jgi:hypothetical protein